MNITPQISATAMVYGLNICENLRLLSKDIGQAEILLYWTPEENNFPDPTQAQAIQAVAAELDMRLSVHLPPMLDLVAGEPTVCAQNLGILLQLLETIAIWQPEAYVLHAGPNPPKLHANPTNYIHFAQQRNLSQWYDATCNVLTKIQAAVNPGSRLLLENLDFSPLLLKPFAERGLANICLDIGHLWLGAEDLPAAFEACAPYIREIHLHGVHNHQEHLSLTATATARLKVLQDVLNSITFPVILNLEIFTPEDFAASLNWLRQTRPFSV